MIGDTTHDLQMATECWLRPVWVSATALMNQKPFMSCPRCLSRIRLTSCMTGFEITPELKVATI